MSVFDDLRNGIPCDIRDPDDRDAIITLERELSCGNLPEGTFFTPPFQVDIACRMMLGRNVFANHGLTAMSIGKSPIEDGVMFGLAWL